MRIALATCRTVPEWETDDLALHEAFRRRGVDFELTPWDDDRLDWSRFDACLIRTTWDHAERRDAYVAWADRIAAATREDMMLQPYFAAVEDEGELSMVMIDGAVTHAVRKVPRAGDDRVRDARVDLLRDDAGTLRLSELELAEPLLFFRHGPHAADALVDGLCSHLG